MKNSIKSLFSLLLSIVIFSSALTFNTSAAGTIIAFSKNPLTVGDSLSDFGSVTLNNSTVTLTKAYAGPTPTVDATSTLTDTNGVVAGNGSGEGGATALKLC